MKLFAVVFMLLSSVAALIAAASNPGTSRIWISEVTIISPENLDHIGEGNVLIEDGRIVSVERKKGRKKPAGATVVSGKGQFLIPGLIDSHVHLASVPGVPLEMSFGPDADKPVMISEYLRQLPRSYLYFGYTTLVDLAVVERRVLDEFRQAPLHPDLYDCGQSLPIANGLCLVTILSGREINNFVGQPASGSAITLLPCLTCFGSGSEPCFADFGHAAV